MKLGYVIIWLASDNTPHYLGTQSDWSWSAIDAHVFATWAVAKQQSRSFRWSEVVEAWI